jgi:hypothetical protein
LRGRGAYELTTLTARLLALTDGRIEAYGSAVPEEWAAAEPETVSKTITFVKNLRDKAEAAAEEFKRAMS